MEGARYEAGIAEHINYLAPTIYYDLGLDRAEDWFMDADFWNSIPSIPGMDLR